MIAIALQSGSNGNCIYVETCGVRLLFDAGIAGSAAEKRLASCGREIRDVDAVIISHDHADHVRNAGVFHRKFGLPVYFSPATFETASSRHALGKMERIHFFRPGHTLSFGSVSVRSVATPHDSAEGAVFVVEAGGKRLGILTDLGHVFEGLRETIAGLDGVFLESNYDRTMLETGRYPAFLKKRIYGPGGHISNRECAELLRDAPGLKWACLSHLSEENNTPDLALRTHRSILGTRLDLHVASRYGASGVFTL